MKSFNDPKQAYIYSKKHPTEVVKSTRLYQSIIMQRCFFVDGVLHGESEWFNIKGKLIDRCFYIDGIRYPIV